MAITSRGAVAAWLLGVLGILALTATVLPAGAQDDELIGYTVGIRADEYSESYAPWRTAERSNQAGILFSIDLSTGETTPIGQTGWLLITGLAFAPDGTLYGVDEDQDVLVTIDPSTGVGTAVGELGVSGHGMGLAFDCGGALWVSSSSSLYRVDPASGAATYAVGWRTSQSLAIRGDTMFGVRWARDEGRLFTIDASSGQVADVGRSFMYAKGLAVAPDGTLWGLGNSEEEGPDGGDWIRHGSHRVYTIDPRTGSASQSSLSDAYGRSLAIPGGSACAEGAGGPGGEADVVGGILDGDAEEPVSEPRAGVPSAAETQSRVDGEGSRSLSGRSESSTVADRAPTVQGVGVAESDDLASAGQGSSGGWVAALIASGILGGLALVGVVGRRRLRGP